jgi:hypothetical protein
MFETDKPACHNIPMLDGNNYTVWSSRMKIFLRGKQVYFSCVAKMDEAAPIDVQTNYMEANNEAISCIVSRINQQCYNEVIDKVTVDSSVDLWTKISNQYTRVHLIVPETTRTKVPRTLPICVGSDVLTLSKNSILPGGCGGFGFNIVCGTFLRLDDQTSRDWSVVSMTVLVTFG